MSYRYLTAEERNWLQSTGQTLKDTRIRRGLSRRQVCEDTGLNENLIRCCEEGLTNNAYTFYHLSKYLGVKL